MAVVRAVLMFVFRILTPKNAIESLEFGTLVLLFAMMLIVASPHVAGFFEWVSNRVILRLTPRQLPPGVTFTSGILSTFLVNDVGCLFMAPLALGVSKRIGLRPLPYLLALATASNIGGAATIAGSPQNMLNGPVSGISYRDFAAHLGPVAVIGLFLDWVLIHSIHIHGKLLVMDPKPELIDLTVFNSPPGLRLMWPVFITIAVLAGFLTGFQPTLVPLPETHYCWSGAPASREMCAVDWSLLLLFLGLRLIIGGAEQAGITGELLRTAERLNLHKSLGFASIVVLLCNIVSNVPAVMLLKGLIPQFQNPHIMWLMLAMSNTLVGNLTITGSVANIMVVEKARTVIT